jgi:CubicO group peptidase (beta-lactamase class C family)
MAIERRALFALSIAFTASIVAYPDLPPDIPPRAGVDGAFIGAPFVAFLLPVAAAAIWWIVASLGRSPPHAAPHVGNAGAATALFLSAFHVTTLVALLGGQLWLGRILGVIVGVFLIATGNYLPRLRPNRVWGIRTRQTLTSDDLWRRVHRLGGYIRVTMGIVLCAAALSGMGGFAQLIVVAVCLETVVCIGAAVFLSRRKSALVGVLLIGCCGIGSNAQAQGMTPGKIAALPAFLDAIVPKLMEESHVAGTAVAVVHDGQITVLRGYGKARLDSGASVDPSRTVFRLGSVTKVFTAAAAVQLAETGKLDLHRDIREFLPDIPLRYGVTTHQLLTHTAGLDERLAGAYTDAPEHLQSLADHLRRYTPEQVYRPGSASSYSNYGYALAGLVIERLSGQPYAEYLADRLFEPLRMTSTTANQPPDANVVNEVARGYRWSDGRHEALPFTFTQAAPAGAMTATAADMGRFMLAVLGDGSLDGQRILSPASVQTLLASQYSPHPRIPGTAYGFSHLLSHGQRLIYRGGTLGDHGSMVVLAPADGLGIFVTSNALPGVGDFLFAPLMTHLAGPAAPAPPATPLPDALQRAPRFAGTYRTYRQVRHEMARVRSLMPMSQSRVTVESDGAIRWQGRRWLEVEPLLFRSVNSEDYIVFRQDEHGAVTGLEDYERIGWREQAPFHLGVLVSCVIAFLAYPLSRGIRALRRRPAAPESPCDQPAPGGPCDQPAPGGPCDQPAPGGPCDQPVLGGRVARGCAVFVALTNLVFVIGLMASLRDLGAITPLPLPFILLLSLPLASVAATALLPAFAVRAWRDNWWTRGERLGYSTFVVFAVAFMTFLNYWKLLGIRY